MSSAWSATSQSMSNHVAYGDAGPSRRTDHSARLCQAGTGTAMWFGTTSTTMPNP